MPPRKPKIFFAIPCGQSYSTQRDVISNIARAANVKPVIVGDHRQTRGLWDKIATQISSADLFVADISSGSTNIALDLGYVLREKSAKKIGIFISASQSVPADLDGFVRQRYLSFADFQSKLIDWLCEMLPMLDRTRFDHLTFKRAEFHDDFKDQESFLNLWSIPSGSSFFLTHEGLRFTNVGLPIFTTTLALLHDCAFEFRARIDSSTIGWVVKGTKDPRSFVPAFCIMFNLNTDGILRPHIWDQYHLNNQSLYQVFPDSQVVINFDNDGWFRLITRVRGDTIEIENDGRTVFSRDFNQDPYAPYYNSFQAKEGQIGFRCNPG
jgi:hypothetical protein